MSDPLAPGSPPPAALADCELLDRHAQSHRLGDLWAERATLVLLVRHFGCIGCSEHLALLSPRLPELAELGVRTLVVGCGDAFFIEGFIERRRLVGAPIEVYTDPSLKTQQAAALNTGYSRTFGPRGLLEMGRAFLQGHRFESVEGKLEQHAGGFFVDRSGTVRLVHRNRSIGDHLAPQAILDVALADLARSQARGH